jgi:hypothetical protein
MLKSFEKSAVLSQHNYRSIIAKNYHGILAAGSQDPMVKLYLTGEENEQTDAPSGETCCFAFPTRQPI